MALSFGSVVFILYICIVSQLKLYVMSKNITITTQGIKGGQSKTNKVGYALIELRHEQDRITIDDFEGSGETYRQREKQRIEIIENGKLLFSGSKYELFEILKGL